MPSPSHARQPLLGQSLSQPLAWIARGLICLLLLVAPWPYAMAEWSSQIWLVPWVGAILLLASVVALLGRLSVGNPLIWSLLAVLAVGFIQLVPLPEALWNRLAFGAGFEQQVEQLASEFAAAPAETSALSPTNTGAVDLVKDPNDSGVVDLVKDPNASGSSISSTPPNSTQETSQFQPSHTLSIHPLQTRTTLCVFAMGLAMLVASTILFRDRRSAGLLLGTLATSGLAVALAGIYQKLVPGEWVLLQDLPKGSSFGTFFSRNSAPQFLACTFAATGGLLGMYRSQMNQLQRDKRYSIAYPSVNIAARLRRRIEDFVSDADVISVLLLVAMVLQAIGVLVANSRGGILAFVASGVIVLLVYSMGRQTSSSVALAVLAMIVGVGLFLSFFGLDEMIGTRLDTISREAYQLDNARLELWTMAISQPTFWLLGSGLGTFHFAILPEYSQPINTWYYHGENIYIELASNAGILTLLVGLGGLIWLLWQLLSRATQSGSGQATRLACIFGVLAIALHNLVDFSLILPAVFLPIACLCGAYLGTRHQVRRKVKRSRHGQRSSQASKSSKASSQGNSTRRVERQWNNGSRSDNSSDERIEHLGEVEQASSIGQRAGEPAWAPMALVVCLLSISAAVMLGYRPLAAFAFAEKLHAAEQPQTEPGMADAQTEQARTAQLRIEWLVQQIQASNQASWARFPESHLQIARWRQELASEQLEHSRNWPAEVTALMRRSVASPEFFSTALHASEDPEMDNLREFVEQEPAVLENLAASQLEMQSALAACPLDWRASWGWLRSDVGESSELERRRNYARLLLTCRSSQRVMQASATHALMTGEITAGQRMWQQLLPVSGLARSKILSLVGRFISLPQFIAILPDSPLLKIELAKNTDKLPDGGIIEKSILDTILLEDAFAAVEHAADWPLVAWCANRQENQEGEIAAWRQAINRDSLNEKLNFALAQALAKAGRAKEALEQLAIALDKSPDNASYLALQQELSARTGQ